MKTWIVRLVLGATMRKAIAYAREIVTVTVDALQGVLDGESNLSDAHRKTVQVIQQAMLAVKEFLFKLSALAGAPDVEVATLRSMDDLKNALDNLRTITVDL